MGKATKRKAGYYRNNAKKAKYGSKLEAGMRGILITCNKREREAVREAYNLLNEYADLLYGPQELTKDDSTKEATGEGSSEEVEESDEDIEDALKKEVQALKEQKPSQRRFQQVNTGANNVLFIRTTLEDPTQLVHRIFSDCESSGQSRSRFILRLLPVLATCSAHEERIERVATEALEGLVGVGGAPTTYCLQIKVRNNSSLSRTSLLPVLGRVVDSVNPNARVDFSEPEYVVNVDVLKTVCCISCLRDFGRFRKYNLQETASPGAAAAASAAAAAAKNKATKTSTPKGEARSDLPKEDSSVNETDTARVIIDTVTEEEEDTGGVSNRGVKTDVSEGSDVQASTTRTESQPVKDGSPVREDSQTEQNNEQRETGKAHDEEEDHQCDNDESRENIASGFGDIPIDSSSKEPQAQRDVTDTVYDT